MSLVLMLLLISLLIVAHEFGHFFVAKWCGVRVERFGFGLPIGPPIFSKKVGDTELCLHWLLFGGYVSFPDDNPDSDIPEDSIERFENQPLLNRTAIALAGVTVNAIMALAIMVGVALTWGLPSMRVTIPNTLTVLKEEAWSKEPPIGIVQALNQDLQISEITVNDKVVSPYTLPLELFRQLKPNDAGHHPHISFWAAGPPSKVSSIIQYKKFTLVSSIAGEAGLRGGETILAINGIPMEGYFGEALSLVPATIQKNAGLPVTMTVEQPNGAVEEILLTPSNEGKIGIHMGVRRHIVKFTNPVKATSESTVFLSNLVVKNFEALGLLAMGQVDTKELAGPIRLVKAGSDVIEEQGIAHGLVLTAIISIILAVMNVLPIPPLDGFHVLLVIIEAIKGNPLDKGLQEKVMTVGYVGLLLLMGFVLWNDVVNTFIAPIG